MCNKSWSNASIIVLYISYMSMIHAQDVSYTKEINTYRASRLEVFQDTLRSPLKDAAYNFEGFHYFPVDTQYLVIAHIELTEGTKLFKMPTSDPNVQKTYLSYGMLHFNLKGKQCQLTVYKSLLLSRNPLYKDRLFLPFRDKTNGVTTYGGGRYLDLSVSEDKEGEIVLDFNKSYFPNCYYIDDWPCPIPPVENTLKIAIKAGERLPGKESLRSNQKH